MTNSTERRRAEWTDAALRTLGIDHFALILFDSVFPQMSHWDIGTGTPYSAMARDLFCFARQLGFNGIQFGPQGAVGRDFPSPYDGTAFSRNPLSIALDELASAESMFAEATPLSQDEVGAALCDRPAQAEQNVVHVYACDRQTELLRRATARLAARVRTAGNSELAVRFDEWCVKNRSWWLADGLYEALCDHYGVLDFAQFPASAEGEEDRHLWRIDFGRSKFVALDAEGTLLGHALPSQQVARLANHQRRFPQHLQHYAWVQFIVHSQHDALHQWAHSQGLELYGDLQVGCSRRDLWRFGSVFLPGYHLGAPPSRTNPDGQPWGYAVLNPELYHGANGQNGPALDLLTERARKQFAEFDRMRIDHPHGLVCPWVYAADTEDARRAVQGGARLFSSPHLPDHPRLRRFSRVCLDQLNTNVPRHADDWVRCLTEEQIGRLATCFDVYARAARARGGVDRLIVEVLSTQPRELGAVLSRHGLGRFRVTQKANLQDPADVYRGENANSEDWVLLGNHDTPTIWSWVDHCRAEGRLAGEARYLAEKLACDEQERTVLTRRFESDPSELVHAKFSDLFLGSARHVLVCFGDLFGFTEPFNTPGEVTEKNWVQRIPRDFRAQYEERAARGYALDVERALRLALRRKTPGSELLRAEPI